MLITHRTLRKIALLAATAAAVAAPQAAQAEPTGYLQIQAAHSGKCLDVAYASYQHGANVVQAYCVNGRNQQWFLWRDANDRRYFAIKARHSHMCLDVAHMSTGHGADVVQGNCWGGHNQQWKFVKEDDIYNLTAWEPFAGPRYRIVARHSQKCLDVAHASVAHGADVVQGTCWNPGYNQRWILKPTS